MRKLLHQLSEKKDDIFYEIIDADNNADTCKYEEEEASDGASVTDESKATSDID